MSTAPERAEPTLTPVEDDGRAAPLRVLADQRKTVILAVVLAVAGYWIFGQLGEWALAGCLAGGVALGLLNHLATELWLLRVISSGASPTRRQLALSTFARLAVLTTIAVAIAVVFWPSGIGLLLGLAVFRLIALVMTGIPLLKELQKA